MYLYVDDPSRAVAQLNKHLTRFRVLCEGWGIGLDTFEFWSWLSKQSVPLWCILLVLITCLSRYRLIADLLDLAMRGGFKLPTHRPIPTTSNKMTNSAILHGINPATALQHPGHLYHLAAICAIQRRDVFKQALAEVGRCIRHATDHEAQSL